MNNNISKLISNLKQEFEDLRILENLSSKEFVDRLEALKTKTLGVKLVNQIEENLSSQSFEFRLNSGFTLRLRDLADRSAERPTKVNIDDILIEESGYATGDLQNGVHVIFGSPGRGKSVMAKTIGDHLGIQPYMVYESSGDGASALTEEEITNVFNKALSEPVSIIDSTRFISINATGFPAIEKGVNSGIFAFLQWLSIVAERQKTKVFVVVSTERRDDLVRDVFKDYIDGSATTAWMVTGQGRGFCIRRDKPRADWIPFEFKNNADWSFSSKGLKKSGLLDLDILPATYQAQVEL